MVLELVRDLDSILMAHETHVGAREANKVARLGKDYSGMDVYYNRYAQSILDI